MAMTRATVITRWAINSAGEWSPELIIDYPNRPGEWHSDVTLQGYIPELPLLCIDVMRDEEAMERIRNDQKYFVLTEDQAPGARQHDLVGPSIGKLRAYLAKQGCPPGQADELIGGAPEELTMGRLAERVTSGMRKLPAGNS